MAESIASVLNAAGIDAAVVSALEANSRSLGAEERLEQEALWARRGRDESIRKVTSYRFNNLLVNWRQAALDIVSTVLELATEQERTMRVLALIRGLGALIGAAGISLDANEARLVDLLWRVRVEEDQIPKEEACNTLGINRTEFDQVMNRLIILGIIETEGDSIRKIDQIFLVM